MNMMEFFSRRFGTNLGPNKPNILHDRLNQLAALYHDIIINPIYNEKYKDDLLDCLTDCWRALIKFYEVKDNDDSRSDK